MNTNNLTNIEKLELVEKLHRELCGTLEVGGLQFALRLFDNAWRIKLEEMDKEAYETKMKNWEDVIVKWRVINNPIGEVQEWELNAKEGFELLKEVVENNLACYWKNGEVVDMKVEIVTEDVDYDLREQNVDILIKETLEKKAKDYINTLIPNGVKEVV